MKSAVFTVIFLFSVSALIAQWNLVHHNYPEPSLKHIDFIDENNGLAVGNTWYYYVTNDGGLSWQIEGALPGEYNDFKFSSNGNAILMESHGTFILFNIFSLEMTILHFSEDDYDLKTMEIIEDSVILTAGFYGIYSFDLEGATYVDTLWTFQSVGITTDPYIVSLCRLGDSTMYAYGNYYSSGILLKSNDVGHTWDIINQNTGIMGFLHVQNEDRMLLAAWDGIYKSVDGGLNWYKTICDPDTGTMTFYDITFTDLNNGYVVGGGSIYPEIKPTKIYKTIDGGDNWYLQYYSNDNALFSVCCPTNSVGYACGDFLTIVKTSNGGGIGVGLQQYKTKEVNINLYPNPFTTSTTIEYELTEPSHVQLTIYNSIGETIHVAVDRMMPQGKHSFIWTADRLPEGLYYAVLRREEGVSVVKMVKQ